MKKYLFLPLVAIGLLSLYLGYNNILDVSGSGLLLKILGFAFAAIGLLLFVRKYALKQNNGDSL